MNKLTLKDKILGALYGCAIGDALGLAGEFMTKEEVAVRYPEPVRSYQQIFRDAHRSQWEPGEWTNDTEVNIRIIEAILENDRFNIHDIAAKLVEWYKECPADLVVQYRFIFKDPHYIDNPAGVAKNVWMEMDDDQATNECITRAVFAGISAERYIERGAKICDITHADPRCVGSCMAIARLAHDLMWHDEITSPEYLIELVRPVDDSIIPYINWATNDTLDPLDLDDEDTLWEARKAMSSALWCVWKDLNPMQAFDALMAEGGDVDTNAAVALSLLGLKYGPEGFPENLRNGLVKKDTLEDLAEKLTSFFIRHEEHLHET